MNARRVRAAEGVVFAAMKTRQTAAGIAAALESACMLQLPQPVVTSPWERAVAGLNALVDAGVAFHVEPDGHISAPFSDEHIEWDLKARRWVLTHDDEDDDSHEAKVAEYLSTPYTDDFASPEDPHDSPLHQSYATPHDLPEQRLPGICPSCRESDTTWCPDCGCCRLGCYGGHEDNDCTHPTAPWTTAPGVLPGQADRRAGL